MRQYSYFISNEIKSDEKYKYDNDCEENFLITMIKHEIIEGGMTYHLSSLRDAWHVITQT
jgi:hypothetical protein